MGTAEAMTTVSSSVKVKIRPSCGEDPYIATPLTSGTTADTTLPVCLQNESMPILSASLLIYLLFTLQEAVDFHLDA